MTAVASPLARLLSLLHDSWRPVLVLASLQFVSLMAVPAALLTTGRHLWVAASLGLGAIVEALRIVLRARLRLSLRTKCLRAAAEDALDKAIMVPEANVDSTFWAAYTTEYAVGTDAPAILAGSAAALATLTLAWWRVGPELAAPLLLLLLVTAAVGLTSQPARNLAAEAVIERRQETANWLAAAERDVGEIFGQRARQPYLDRVSEEAARWCRAEYVLERRRFFNRLLLASLIVSGLFLILVARGADLLGMAAESTVTVRAVTDVLLVAWTLPVGFLLIAHCESVLLALTQLRTLSPTVRRLPRTTSSIIRPATRLRTPGLVFRYGEHLALKLDAQEIDLRRPLVLVGPNGSGKTTFAALVAGVLTPSEGSIAIDDIACSALDRDQIVFVPQAPLMVEALSILENVRLVVPGVAPSDASRALLDLGLQRELSVRAGALSRGEQRRVAIARALLKDPALLILDEPDAWLDSAGRQALGDLIAHEAERRAVLLVSHRGDLIPDGATVLTLTAQHELSPSAATHRGLRMAADTASESKRATS